METSGPVDKSGRKIALWYGTFLTAIVFYCPPVYLSQMWASLWAYRTEKIACATD
jgi:hypothetical protein